MVIRQYNRRTMLVKGLHAAALRSAMFLFQFALLGSSKLVRNKQFLMRSIVFPFTANGSPIQKDMNTQLGTSSSR